MKFKTAWVAVVNEHNEVLLGKRADSINAGGTWNIFGGRREELDTPITTAARELVEESGLRVNPEQLQYYGTIDRAYFYVWCVKQNIIDASVRVNIAECSKAKWYPITDLPNNLHKHTAAFVKQYIKNGVLARKVHQVNASFSAEILEHGARAGIKKVKASLDGDEVGHFFWWPKTRWLYSLHVNPSFRGLGIARLLLDHAVETVGYPINLHPEATAGLSQASLVSFYERYGFKDTGEGRNIMRLDLESRATKRLATAALLKYAK